MSEQDDSQHIILTSFEDEFEETNDPVWAWHAIDFCSNWQRKTGTILPYPQWVTDYLSMVADSMLKLDDRTIDPTEMIVNLIGVKKGAISTSIQTIRNKLIYFEIQSFINQGHDNEKAIEAVAKSFSLPLDVVEKIFQMFQERGH